MKRIVFSFVLFLGFAASVSAQEPAAERMKPAGGDFGLGFKITGLSNINFSEWDNDHFAVPQMLGRYYISDKFALRARIGLDMTNVRDRHANRDEVAVGGYVRDTLIDTKTTGSNFSLFPGVEYHMASAATKIDPYIGFELGLSVIGKTTYLNTSKLSEFDANNNLTKTSESIITTTKHTPGGMGFGGNVILGFNYFFTDNFALGAEYTIGTAYTKTGGIADVTTSGAITQPQAGTSTIVDQPTYEYETTNSDMHTQIRSTGGVNISVFW